MSEEQVCKEIIEQVGYQEFYRYFQEKTTLIEQQRKEIERLNNIINELNKAIIEFKKQIEEERKNYREIIGNFVDKLQELKGNNNGVWVNNLLEVIKENNIEFGSDKE